MILISVIVPTHNPHPGRLRRTLAGLAAQTLRTDAWELIVVDNASSIAITTASLGENIPPGTRIVREPTLGLTFARRRGLQESRGALVVLVDDDNVLSPDYLENALHVAERHPTVGAFGGRSIPEFDASPAPWQKEFFGLLALRDLGPREEISGLTRHADHGRWHYPTCSPIGAGMVVRRDAVSSWLESNDTPLTDRRGDQLTSGGDNDIVLTILRAGWQVGYFPELSLTHLIPAERISIAYLERLNRGIQHSWMHVLFRHDANPWSQIPAWTVPLRQAKAWFVYRAWSSPAARIRWKGACGHFEGRATYVSHSPRRAHIQRLS